MHSEAVILHVIMLCGWQKGALFLGGGRGWGEWGWRQGRTGGRGGEILWFLPMKTAPVSADHRPGLRYQSPQHIISQVSMGRGVAKTETFSSQPDECTSLPHPSTCSVTHNGQE